MDNSKLSNISYIQKLTNFIIDLEKKYDLLEWEIDGVLAWQSARISIYLLLRSLIASNHTFTNGKTFAQKLKVFYRRVIINSVFYNPFLDFTKSEVLVFESSRKYFVDDQYIDIYTKYFCDDLEAALISYTKYGTNYAVDDLAERSFTVKHLDFISLASKLLSSLINPSVSKKDTKRIKTIEDEINNSLGIRIDLRVILINEIRIFKSQYPFYKLLFQLKKPKEIYLIDSPSKAPLIKAAKDSNVIVNELQHGLIVKEEIVTNFPKTEEDSLQYFPNKFFLWDNLDTCTAKIPLSKNNIIYFKNRHIEYMLNKCENIKRKDNHMLILSQVTGFNEIFKFVLDNIEEMKNWQFIYKLPAGRTLDTLMPTSNFKLSRYENLIIIENDQSLYPLMAESKYALGVYSTGLFEASYFGCEIFLLNLPGVEQASALIEQKKAKLIDTNERLSKYL